jgi:hypothetical protein
LTPDDLGASASPTGPKERWALATSTRELLGGDGFEERQVEVKGLGMMRTYLVTES